ncbi:hypothetical protein G6F32_009472 [Rhizopus arrhizus]|nr:hypothetical protein G6F32_009472 [Rhizopus arrhizus]
MYPVYQSQPQYNMVEKLGAGNNYSYLPQFTNAANLNMNPFNPHISSQETSSYVTHPQQIYSTTHLINLQQPSSCFTGNTAVYPIPNSQSGYGHAQTNVFVTQSAEGNSPLVTPFSGDVTMENLYQFLEDIRLLKVFKQATTDEEKINVAGSFLKDDARRWFAKQTWKGVSFEGGTTGASFVEQFVKEFLPLGQLYILRQEFSNRVQGIHEEASNYLRDKLKLYQKFHMLPEPNGVEENDVLVEVMRGLNLQTKSQIKSVPTSLQDLRAQLKQADWMFKEMGMPWTVNNTLVPLVSHSQVQQIHAALMDPLTPQGQVRQLQQIYNSLIQNAPMNVGISSPMVSLQMAGPSHAIHTTTATPSDPKEGKQELLEEIRSLMDERFKSLTKQLGNPRTYGGDTAKETSRHHPGRRPCYNCNQEGHNQRECTNPCGACGDRSHTLIGCKRNNTQGSRQGHDSSQDFHGGRRL